MPIAGVPAGTPTGVKAGALAGDFAGQKTQVTTKALGGSVTSANAGGGTVIVGTIPAEQATVPLRGIGIKASKVRGAHGGATIHVNARLDGGSLIAGGTLFAIKGPPGATLSVSPTESMNQQSAHGTLGTGALPGQLHTVNFMVKDAASTHGSTFIVTPTITALADD